MIDFLAQHLPELIMSLVTAGALGLCGWFHQQTINYQKLLKEQENERVQELIKEQIEPLVTELKDIRKYVKDFEKRETAQVNLIISFYKQNLISLCETYLKQGYITTEQYKYLSEFYKVYKDLGGNGQGRDYYNKATCLPIKD